MDAKERARRVERLVAQVQQEWAFTDDGQWIHRKTGEVRDPDEFSPDGPDLSLELSSSSNPGSGGRVLGAQAREEEARAA